MATRELRPRAAARVVFGIAIALLVFAVAACGSTEGNSSGKDPKPEAGTQGDVATEDDIVHALPALMSLNELAVTGAQLYACVGQSCMAANGQVLSAKVDRATRSLSQAITEVGNGCLKASLVDFRAAFRSYEKAALSATGRGRKSQTLASLDAAIDRTYVARDRFLGCDLPLPQEAQAAALDMSGLVAKISAINNAMYECETESCVREQGRLLERTSAKGLSQYESMLDGIDGWREQPPRCLRVRDLTRSMFQGFKRYGQAARMFDAAEMLDAYNSVNSLIVQRKEQLQTCLSG